MEQIQKQIQRKRREVEYDPLPEPVDESELLEQTERILGKVAAVLLETEKGLPAE